MPYIIETTTPCRAQFGRCKDPEHADITHTAVATLDEARKTALETVRVSNYRGQWMLPFIRATNDLPESGGTIGPLPDGTVIEVQWRSWPDLQADANIAGLPRTDSYVLAAFNDR